MTNNTIIRFGTFFTQINNKIGDKSSCEQDYIRTRKRQWRNIKNKGNAMGRAWPKPNLPLVIAIVEHEIINR